MTVRAKFKVTKIEQTSHMRKTGENDTGVPIYTPGELRTIVLQPVYSSDPASENAAFWAASPSGEIRLGTINEQAWQQFVLDGEFHIDFTPAS